MSGLTHFDAEGQAHMVDVSAKADTDRSATAEGFVNVTAATLDLIAEKGAKKGDVLAIAQLAGLMGAKRTPDLIPLCHPLPISNAEVSLEIVADRVAVRIEATVKTTGKTGVEMEALTAVSVAALTVYDMIKAVEKGAEITGIRLLKKSGGKSGTYEAQT